MPVLSVRLSVSAAEPAAPLLDEARAAFIQQRVAINVASCNGGRVPSLARAVGCRVSADRRKVTLFLAVPRSTTLLRDLRAGSGVAAVFVRPTSHESIQLKGTRAEIVPLVEDDRDAIDVYAKTFLEEIFRLGYRDPFASALAMAIGEDLVGVRFEPTAAFLQTPGPLAGTRLGEKP